MPKSSDLFFVSSNNHKYEEAKQILDNFGISLGFVKYVLEEIQTNSLKEIASKKAKMAFLKCKKPVIIEDDGLFINSLDGFPGPYSSYVFQTIGNNGVLKLLKKNRDAKFVSVITYCDKNNLQSFIGNLYGTISHSLKNNGWGYDPIFIPKNMTKTFAELENKNKISHRFKALKKFSKWYLDMQESNDQ